MSGAQNETQIKPLKKAFRYTFEFSKSQDDAERLIDGYATTEAVDRMGEVIELSAVEKALADYKAFPVIYADHSPPPVAEAVNLSIDKKGLRVESKFFNRTQASEEAWELVQQGGYRAYSIAGYVEEVEFKEKDGEEVPHITGLSIAEISLTGAPANPECLFDVIAKSIKWTPDKHEEKSMTDEEQTNTPEDEAPTELEVIQKDVGELKGVIGELVETVKGLQAPSQEEEETPANPEHEELAKTLAPLIAKELGLQHEPTPVRSAELTNPPDETPKEKQSDEPMTILRMLSQSKGYDPRALEELQK